MDKKINKKFLKTFLLLAWGFLSALSFAQVKIDIPEARSRAAQNIAVVPFSNDRKGEIDYIISADLFKSGFFKPISPKKFSDRPNSPSEINYGTFASLGASYVVIGRVLGNGEGQVVLSEVGGGAVVLNEKIKAANSRAFAHRAANLILEKLTGKAGIFDSKIAYILERGKGENRSYSLVVADSDGGNRREIARSNEPILSPSWSPNGASIAYMTYANYKSQIVVKSAGGGGGRVVVQSESTVSAPSWSPNSSSLAVAMADKNGNTDIYLVDMGGGKRRLTNSKSIDTEPVFSSDGRYIYFTSDRGGSPQIYRMNPDGSGVSRAVVGGRYSSNADLSPDNRYMALTRQSGGGYQIGLYELGSGRFTALSSGRLDEGASFAPNGELLIYATSEGSRRVLKMVNLKGEVVQTLSDPNGKMRDPAWQPKK